jgi:hypothetical protein
MITKQPNHRNSASTLGLLLPLLLLAAMLTPSSAPAQDASNWYAFQPAEDVGPSVIGMESWLDAPAGNHGGVRMVGDHFEFANGGGPVKFWGVNLGNTDCEPDKALGEKWAASHAKYGINCVRLHKFIGPSGPGGAGGSGIGDPNDSTKFTPEGLDRLDYFTSQLKKHGIYYGWSWVYEHEVRPADKAHLLAYDEIVAAGKSTTGVPLFIGEDVQDLRISMLTNLLAHKNPYTGLTYAEDPALSYIEFENEDCIFFYTFGAYSQKLNLLPTYKKAFNQKFSRYLKAKYKDQDGLVKAWGDKALNAYEAKDESLDQETIMVQGNPWFASPEGLAQAKGLGTERRILDTEAFLYEVQSAYYGKFKKAIQTAGYQGPLVGSCWTSPAGVPQYLNLLTDANVGIIDRHTYFGGQTQGYQPKPGKFDKSSQLDVPGSGMLSSGLLQVKDHPFTVSEWTTVFPNEWVMESPAIFAAYGMGLQGWDGSYEFASHVGEYKGHVFASRTGDPRLWVIDQPTQIGLYPALARMIYRGDVKEAPVISTRHVTLAELRDGQPDWLSQEAIKQSGDFKEYTGAVPAAALAVGRAVVEFGDAPQPTEKVDMAKYVKDGAIESVTGQLRWYGAQGGTEAAGAPGAASGQRGYFTINTDGTKAAVGFLPKQPIIVGNVTFQPPRPSPVSSSRASTKPRRSRTPRAFSSSPWPAPATWARVTAPTAANSSPSVRARSSSSPCKPRSRSPAAPSSRSACSTRTAARRRPRSPWPTARSR